MCVVMDDGGVCFNVLTSRDPYKYAMLYYVRAAACTS